MAHSLPSKTAAPRQGVLARLRATRDTLPPTAKKIADFILAQPDEVVHMSVTEVAEGAGASDGSVVGFCQQLGTKGFQDLKIALARDLVEPVQFIHEDLNPLDGVATVIQKIFHSDIQALQDTLKVLDPAAMAQAVTLILVAKRVEFYGIGSATPVAVDAHYRMLRIGIPCSVYTDSHVQSVSASLTGPDVVTVTISHSGSTVETLAATRLAKEAGAKTIVITNFGKSPIQQYADVVLYTAARETAFRTEAMTSRIAELSIVDALNACVALASYEKSLQTIGTTFDVLSTKRF
jgi:DNA-binding MurR/RpiR family transcriptional regulator